jgi:hypothetical protein
MTLKKLTLAGTTAVVVVAIVLIAGCTSSTSTNSTQSPGAGTQLPTANAGADQEGKVGTTVTLDGSGSSGPNGGALTYNWSLGSVPTNSSVRLVNPTSVHPTFTPDKAGTYVARLVVADHAGGQSQPSSVSITCALQPSNTTLTARVSKTDLNIGDTVIISGNLVDANGRGIPNQTISFTVEAHVLGFTSNVPVNSTTTDATGAFSQSVPVTSNGAPSFITQVNLEGWAAYAGSELYKPSTTEHVQMVLHL